VAAVAAPPRESDAVTFDGGEVPFVVDAPRPGAKAVQVRRPSRGWVLAWPPLRNVLVASWIAVNVSVYFQPAPNPNVAEPWLSGVLSVVYPLVLIAGVLAAVNGVWRAALGCSFAAGSAGLLMAYQCAVTLHHAPVWWMYELAAFGYLTTLSAGGYVVRARAGRV
jgi:hypothetical protein